MTPLQFYRWLDRMDALAVRVCGVAARYWIAALGIVAALIAASCGFL